jgi:hypothetical protein
VFCACLSWRRDVSPPSRISRRNPMAQSSAASAKGSATISAPDREQAPMNRRVPDENFPAPGSCCRRPSASPSSTSGIRRACGHDGGASRTGGRGRGCGWRAEHTLDRVLRRPRNPRGDLHGVPLPIFGAQEVRALECTMWGDACRVLTPSDPTLTQVRGETLRRDAGAGVCARPSPCRARPAAPPADGAAAP